MGVTTVSTLPGRLCERTGDDAAKTTTTMANSKSDADEEESSRAAALRLDGGGGIGATKAVTKERNAATARSTNLTPGKPRRCSNCGKRFDSGNKLHAHLKDCPPPTPPWASSPTRPRPASSSSTRASGTSTWPPRPILPKDLPSRHDTRRTCRNICARFGTHVVHRPVRLPPLTAA